MVVGGIPVVVYEHMSNVLVNAGYFPSDPTAPFVIEIMHTSLEEDDSDSLLSVVTSAHLASLESGLPCVCCLLNSRAHSAIVHGTTWEPVQHGPTEPPLLLVSV